MSLYDQKSRIRDSYKQELTQQNLTYAIKLVTKIANQTTMTYDYEMSYVHISYTDKI